MGALSNALAFVAALGTALPLAFASALPNTYGNFAKYTTILRRDETLKQYDQTSIQFAKDGICRRYITGSGHVGNTAKRISCALVTTAVTSFVAPTANVTSLPNDGLQDLDNITCAVWLKALKETVMLGFWIIPSGAEAGTVAKASRTSIKSIKRFDESEDGKTAWVDLVESKCQVKD